jgi:hypothetical protein
MTKFVDIAPTPGDAGVTYEWILDIGTGGTAEAPTWLNIPDITAFNPAAPAKTKDASTYAHKGGTANKKTGEDFSTSFNVLGIKDSTGEFQPELVALIEAGDANGDENIIPYRYYHRTSKVLAYQGTAAVSFTRANNGNDDLEFFSISLAGQGDRKKITNPAVTP